MKVNERFVKIRMIDMGLKTKNELLEKINIAPDTFNKKLKGDRDWKLNELWKLSQVLDCEVQELLIIKEDEKENE